MKHARAKAKDKRERLAAVTEPLGAAGLDSPPAQRAGSIETDLLIDDDEPGEQSGFHLSWDRRSQRAAALILAGLLAVVGWWWWSGQPNDGVPMAQTTPTAAQSDEDFIAAPTTVVVHVVGDVESPGVAELPSGSRVQDAIDAVGGPTKKRATSTVNLARMLVDGEQIVVGAQVQDPGDGTISINNADATALEQLPGVGPVIAERIVQWRTENGPFRSVEELAEISGIGAAMVDRIKDQVRM